MYNDIIINKLISKLEIMKHNSNLNSVIFDNLLEYLDENTNFQSDPKTDKIIKTLMPLMIYMHYNDDLYSL
jgi:hypothetical protein